LAEVDAGGSGGDVVAIGAAAAAAG